MDHDVRDPRETTTALQRWLTDVQGFAAVEIDAVSIPAATGASNETVLFDATWVDDGAPSHHELVARIAPTSNQVFPDDTFELQFDIIRGLAPTPVPVPAMYWLERDPAWFGSAFWVMERVHGEIPSDAPPYAGSGWLADASAEQQAHTWSSGIAAMARVHALSPADLGIPTGRLVATGDPLDAELARYERHLAWAEDGAPHPLAREARRWLDENRPPARGAAPTLVWGDSRLSNLVYRDFGVVAVLDWEMATFGDPLLDLGWWVFADEVLTKGSGLRRLPGFGSRDETGAEWGRATGRSPADLDYFVVFAGFRFTVIMVRLLKLMAQRGLVPESYAYDNLVSQGLARALAS